MAIYHLHVKIIQRSKGQSAVASSAYRRAAKLFDERESRTWNYTAKPNVLHREIIAPEHAPTWAKDIVELHQHDLSSAAEKLWNSVEHAEKRKDSQLAREADFALPIELTLEENIHLARNFIHDQFVLRGMIADWNVHWDAGNPHVHVMLTMRELTEAGFGKRMLEWNQRSLLQAWREKWSEYANFHLRLHQHDVRIDHRSYKDQGIDLIPSTHLGKAVSDMEQRGITTDTMREANEIRRENLVRIASDPNALLKKMTAQSDIFTAQQLGQALGTYINDQGKFSTHNRGVLAEHGLAHLNQLDIASGVLSPNCIAKILQTIEYHESIFTERDLAKAITPFTQHAEQFAKALMQVKLSPNLIALGPGDDGRDRFTTKRMFAVENRIQTLTDQMRKSRHQKISDRQVQKTLNVYERKTNKKLTIEQLQAVKHLIKPTAVSCLIGRAGTGKSFSLGAAKAIWESQQLRVQGVALSGIAADGLRKDADITSRTIESFRLALAEGKLAIDARDVIVMDEAGMTDSIAMKFILEKVQQAKAKLVLVGDPDQIQPVGPGASFRAIVERIGFSEIRTVYRQQKDWQRTATVDFSAGKIAGGLTAYESRHCIHLSKTADDAMQQLVSDWFKVRELGTQDLSQYLVIGHRNEDVRQLNESIRAARIARDEIAEGYSVATELGEIKIAQHDRLIFLKNDKNLGVNNGRFATVTTVKFTESGKVLNFSVKLDGNDKEVVIDPSQYKSFAHGYAATVHKVQGVTVDHVFVYAAGFGWNRCLTYVAMTRHRLSAHLYAAKEQYRDLALLKKQLGRRAIKDSVLDFPLAFAERRGLDNSILLKLLPKHLLKRLKKFKETLVNRYAQLINPQHHANQLQELTKEQHIAEDNKKRREDAKLVAAYADANREVGRVWQTLEAQLSKLGITKISYKPDDLSIIVGTTAYKELQQAVDTRNERAAAIISYPERYKLALEIHAVNIDKLRKESEFHAANKQVKAYAAYHAQGKVVLRDRVAAAIMPAIKTHYAYLKRYNLAGDIKNHALVHLKRQKLQGLSTQERSAFRLVEKYQMTTNQFGKQWSEMQSQIAEKKSSIDQRLIASIDKLGAERKHLAFQIMQTGDSCDTALDFFQIGRMKSHFGEKLTNEHEKQAEVRWYKLQQTAARYERAAISVENKHKVVATAADDTHQKIPSTQPNLSSIENTISTVHTASEKSDQPISLPQQLINYLEKYQRHRDAYMQRVILQEQDPEQAKIHSAISSALYKELTIDAKHLMLDPIIQQTKQARPKHSLNTPHIADLGGHAGICERLKQGKWESDDIQALISDINRQANVDKAWNRDRSEDRSRGRTR